MSDYQAWLREKAVELGTDGCSWVTEAFHIWCLEHDIAYRTRRWPSGLYRGKSIPMTYKQADDLLFERIVGDSAFGMLSPIAWVRWIGLRTINRLRGRI